MNSMNQVISNNENKVAGFNPFRILSNEERKSQLDSYLGFLRENDGVKDVTKGILGKREARFNTFYEQLDQNRSTAIPLRNIADFLDNTPPENLDKRLLWLLINAKTNRSEKYGADKKLEALKSGKVASLSEVNQYILLEEKYHTQILVGACQLCSFDVEIKDPPLLLRLIVDQMLKLPKLPSDYLIFLGEIVGVHIFSLLLENTKLFSDQPKLQRQLRELIQEILSDEVGHVVYCRTQIPGWLMVLAKPLVKLMARHVMWEIPEIVILAGGKAAFLSRMDKDIYFPEPASWLQETNAGQIKSIAY